MKYFNIHSDFEECHISCHDVFGKHFKSLWVSNKSVEINEFELQEGEEVDLFLLKDELQNLAIEN